MIEDIIMQKLALFVILWPNRAAFTPGLRCGGAYLTKVCFGIITEGYTTTAKVNDEYQMMIILNKRDDLCGY